MLPCAYKEIFGIDCPTCGAQRSLALLLEGDIIESFKMYPPLIPVLFLGLVWVARFFKPSQIQLAFAKKLSWLVLGLVMVNYVVNIFI